MTPSAEKDASLTVSEAQAAIQRVLDTTEWYCADDHDWHGYKRLSERLHEALRLRATRVIPPVSTDGGDERE